MPKIDTEAELERLDRIFDEIAGKMPEEPTWRAHRTECTMSDRRNCERWRHEK